MMQLCIMFSYNRLDKYRVDKICHKQGYTDIVIPMCITPNFILGV